MRETRKVCYDFRGHMGYPVTASGVGSPFVTAVTGAGPPALSGIEGGGLRLGLEATNEAQNLTLYFGDVLSFDIDDLVRAEFVVKSSVATLNASVSMAWGVASEQNNTIDTIAEQALFRCEGDSSIFCETDDGTNNNDDIASGVTFGTNWTRFAINFAERNTTQEPPSLSLGRPSNVGFYAGLAQANSVQRSLRRVASGTRFDMSNYAGGLQPYLQVQKSTGTAVDALDVLAIELEFSIEA